MSERVRQLLEDSGINQLVNSGTYRGASGWPFVGLVLGLVTVFVAAFVVLAVLGLEPPVALVGFATYVVGHVIGLKQGRTFRQK